jgi:hypothetical protein
LKKQTPITTLSFFKYESIKSKIWAFGMMQFAHKHLQNVDGMGFYKLMGSGKQLGRPFADWSVYALLQVWEDESHADKFIRGSSLFSKYRQQAAQHCSIYMKCLSTHGEWSKQTPFLPVQNHDKSNPYVAVITRATIKSRWLWTFWRQAIKSEKPIHSAEGLLYAKGIGEVPLKHMATFSIWSDIEGLKKYAYRTKEHNKAIKMTRALDWYAEESFSRFQPYRIDGHWPHLELNL